MNPSFPYLFFLLLLDSDFLFCPLVLSIFLENPSTSSFVFVSLLPLCHFLVSKLYLMIHAVPGYVQVFLYFSLPLLEVITSCSISPTTVSQLCFLLHCRCLCLFTSQTKVWCLQESQKNEDWAFQCLLTHHLTTCLLKLDVALAQ